MPSPEMLGLAFSAAVIAGFLDSIAGGGGLVTLPVLLAMLGDPAQTIATLKTQSLFGTLAATVKFARQGLIQPLAMSPAILSTVLGGAAGAIAVQTMSPKLLMTIVPILLLSVALYVACSPRVSELDSREWISAPWFTLGVAPIIGFYGGFFGPGTGAFFAVAFVALRGFGLVKATAHTKLLDCTASFGAVALFVAGGKVVWPLAIMMGVGQAFGAYAGANFVIRRGAALIRPVLVTVSVAITFKLIFDDPESWAHRLVGSGLGAIAAQFITSTG